MCFCEGVELEIVGPPITALICHCDDCQEGSRRIEALPNGHPVREQNGGTAYAAYRKDRVRCSKGASLLVAHKIREGSATKRLVATCCATAMLLGFEDRKHWVDVYWTRIRRDPPQIEMHVCTKFRREGVDLPRDIPSYSGYPARFLAKLVVARIAMIFDTRMATNPAADMRSTSR